MLIAEHLVSHRASGLNPARHPLDVRTRDRVRQAISEDGPLTASILATRLGLTPAAVRRHLDPLVEKGAIEEQEPATPVGRGRGRPARAYVLSAAGRALMDSDYDDAATAALRFLAEHAGEKAVGEFARKRIAEAAQPYAAELAAAGEDVTARAEAPAAALTANGYVCTTSIPLSAAPVLERSDPQGPPAGGQPAPAGALIDTPPDTD